MGIDDFNRRSPLMNWDVPQQRMTHSGLAPAYMEPADDFFNGLFPKLTFQSYMECMKLEISFQPIHKMVWQGPMLV